MRYVARPVSFVSPDGDAWALSAPVSPGWSVETDSNVTLYIDLTASSGYIEAPYLLANGGVCPTGALPITDASECAAAAATVLQKKGAHAGTMGDPRPPVFLRAGLCPTAVPHRIDMLRFSVSGACTTYPTAPW